MPSGDGLLVRVKPPGGRLPAAALRAIADGAIRYGNGAIDLTSRGNLQIRGLSAGSAPSFAEAMVAAGLADADPERERRRNVIAVPPYDDGAMAAVEAVLAETAGLAAKFCVAVGPAVAGLMVHAGLIWCEGRPHSFSQATLRMLVGAAAGRRLAATPPPRAEPAGVLLALPFGQTTAAALQRLAALTDGARTTPWRALHIPEAADLGAYARAGFVTDPGDPRLGIAACPGAPACASGTTATRADAAALAAAGVTAVHVSGCAKGCARPRPGLTLTARDGRYDLIPHGRAGDAPVAAGLTLRQAIAVLASGGMAGAAPGVLRAAPVHAGPS